MRGHERSGKRGPVQNLATTRKRSKIVSGAPWGNSGRCDQGLLSEAGLGGVDFS